ncbi:HEAT repeat domain-containing protein [Streptomyces sp. NPDC058470]|uniref:HEAT repeat domain-containing protein n=1 Tax=Streptomyces sp. NPDC058470 TaxID=3346515 RepID=UPI00366260D5
MMTRGSLVDLLERHGVNADLIRDLGRPDRHEAAADALVTLGAGGVKELVREVMDAESPVDWRPITAVLGRIGDAGFDGLLQGLVSASTEESRKRVGFAFSQLGMAVLDLYVAALAHPVPLVRRQGVRGIEHCEEAGRSAAVLLPLLGDPDQEVARQAQDTLIRSGEQVTHTSVTTPARLILCPGRPGRPGRPGIPGTTILWAAASGAPARTDATSHGTGARGTRVPRGHVPTWAPIRDSRGSASGVAGPTLIPVRQAGAGKDDRR